MKWYLWIVFICAFVFGAAFPFFEGWTSSRNDFDFGAYGSWLQGTLTPIALILAAISFHSQARKQTEANQLFGKAYFMDVLTKYEGHLNYLIGAAVRGEYVSAEEITKKERLYSINEVAKGEIGLQEGEQLTHLKTSLEKFIRLASDHDSSEFVNRNVIKLSESIKNGQCILKQRSGNEFGRAENVHASHAK